MNNVELKKDIKLAAITLFNEQGYHGTTIRNIATKVGCSLPMVYYYYENKKALFHEIIRQDYFDMLKRCSAGLDPSNVIKYYVDFICRLNELKEYDRMIYRIGLKVYLGFDGDEEVISVMERYEKSITKRNHNIILPHIKNKEKASVIVSTFIHLMENLIERIIIKGEKIDRRQAEEELILIIYGS